MNEKFGRYYLLERIAIGGMAEIFRAKAPSLGGFEKVLAIKRLHPRYSQDEDFIEMLIDEARITAELSHNNIGQIFDLGQIDDHYFIAMEYIDGRDLYRIMRRMRETKTTMPIELASLIALEICAGLDYAHRKRDSMGRQLRIVHRDVSPQNMLVSFDGDVKIVDFGIAKAAFRAYETEAGIIKGKFYYMSPEQARGEDLDHRTDVFSLGIVLYEMVTGQLLYKDDDETTLLSRVRDADIAPPSLMRDDLPSDLEKIIMKALAKERSDRYPSAQHMQRDLSRFLRRSTRPSSKSELGNLVKRLFADDSMANASIDSLRDRSEFMDDESSLIASIAFGDGEDPTMAEEGLGIGTDLIELDSSQYQIVSDTGSVEMIPEPSDPPEPIAQFAGESIEADDFLDDEPTRAFEGSSSAQGEPSNYPYGPGHNPAGSQLNNTLPPVSDPFGARQSGHSAAPEPVVVAKSVGEVSPVAVPSPVAEPAQFEHQPTVVLPEDEPQAPAVEPVSVPKNRPEPVAVSPSQPAQVEQKKTSSGEVTRERVMMGLVGVIVMVVSLTATALVLKMNDGESTDRAVAPIAVVGTDKPNPEPTVAGKTVVNQENGKRAVLIFGSEPAGARVLVDGKWLFENTPVRTEVPAGRPVAVTMRLKGYETYSTKVTLEPDESRRVTASLKRVYGTLTVESVPSNAMVYINGREFGRTPRTIGQLPLDRATPLKLTKTGFETHEVAVEWTGENDEREKSLKVRLKPKAMELAPVAKKTRSRSSSRRRNASRGGSKTARKSRRSGRRSNRDSGGSRSRAGRGYLKVVVRPWGQIFVDGKLVHEEGPLVNYPLSEGRHKVYACIRGDRRECTRSESVYIRRGETELLRFP